MPFLVAGHIAEPRIAFSRPSLNFKQVLLGRTGKGSVELINSEDVPFSFAFDKSTYDATDDIIEASGQQPAVTFEPSRGTLQPNSSLTIHALFKPGAEKLINYTLVCNVKKKPTRLTLNVKGEGYAIHESMTLEAPDSQDVVLSAQVRPFSCRSVVRSVLPS